MAGITAMARRKRAAAKIVISRPIVFT